MFKKRVAIFKGKIRKRLKSYKKEVNSLKNMYQEQTNIKNNLDSAISNMQSDINELRKELGFAKTTIEIKDNIISILKDKSDKIADCFSLSEEQKDKTFKKIEKQNKEIEILKNRIKYEFKGD